MNGNDVFPVEPPAIVRSADRREELAPKIRATYRRTQEDRKQLGLWLLECKEWTLRAGEEWLEWLERETGIPQRTATRWMDSINQRQEQSVISQVANDAPGLSVISDPGIEADGAWGGLVDENDEPIDSITVDSRRQMARQSADNGDYEEAAELAREAGDLQDRLDGNQSVPHVAHNSGDNEWYTPPIYLDAARRVLGGLDIDPASSEIAQRTVGAASYYTKDDDGLQKSWSGRLWMNPPYAAGLVDQFVGKLCEHYQAGDVTAAIVLVNNATETQWFQRCMSAASAICFPQGRVRFLNPEGNTGAPLQGQAILYLGRDASSFCATFCAFGSCLRSVGQ